MLPNANVADHPSPDSMRLPEPVKKCTFSEMLDYLVESGSITKTKAEGLKKNPEDLAVMLVIFTDSDWATNFLSSLPVDNPILAGDLIAANFEAMCYESTIGWDGIQSIAFDISSKKRPKLEWAIPFDTSTSDQAYLFVHTSNFRITVEWPAYLKRTVSGNYRGTLAHGKITHYVVGQFTVQDPEGAKYSMAFTNDKYETKNYSLSVGQLLNFFNCAKFPFNEQKGWMAAALVADLLKKLNLDSDLTNPSFVLELQSYVSVKEIAGYFPLKIDFHALKLLPFNLDAIPLEFTKLQVVLRDIGSPDIRTLLLQQYGKIFKLPGIPFRLTLGLSAEQPYYEVAIVPDGVDPVPIKQILEAFGLSSTITDEDFSFIENLSTALAISNASVGWAGKELHYLSLAVEIADWKLESGGFVVQNFLMKLRAVAPASKDKHLYFYGSGTINISDVEIELVWNLDRSDSGTVINFQVATAQRPINVGSILGHFNIKESLPEGFAQLLDATNVDGVTLQVVKDTSGWSISRFALKLDIRTEFDIFSQFKLASPKFLVDVADPFNSRGKRSSSAVIKAAFVIEEDLTCNASLKLSNAKRGLLEMDLEADENQPVNMGSLFKLFGLDFQGVSIPESVSFLLSIGLTKFNFSLELMNNKWGMNDLSVKAVSSTSLQIWKELKLDRLSLEFLYSKHPQRKAATVKALLSFGTEADLDVGFSYTGPSTTTIPEPQPTPENVEVSTDKGASWKAEVEYRGAVSLLKALSRVTEVDIGKDLESVGLRALRDVMYVDLSHPKMTLIRAKDQTSFDFSSGVNTKYFSGNVDLSCSRSTSWIYNFGFTFDYKDFFKDLGIGDLGLVLDNTTVRLTNGSNRKALVNTTAGNRILSVEFSGKLVINDLTKNLKSFIKSVELIGPITSNSFSIWVKVDDFTLFDNSLKLSGEVGAIFSSSQTLQVGLRGTVKDIDLHDISSEKFTVGFGLYIKLPNPQLGLEFKSESTLKDAFKVKGLVIKALEFNASFQEFPVPSFLHIYVKEVSFKDTFDGRLDVYYKQSKLTACYAKGLFTNDKLEFSKSLSAVYDKNQPISPKCVDGNFFGLLFWVTWPKRILKVPQPDGTEKEQQIQGFYLKGDLNFTSIDFSALFIISITTQDPIGVLVHGSIKNAIVAPSTGNTLFALRDARPDYKKLGPYLSLMLVQGKLPYFDASCEVYFLGLTLSTNVKLSLEGFELHEKMSFTGSDALKREVKFDIVINKTQFDFKAGCYLDIVIKDGKIGDTTIPKLTVVKLDASLSTTINWTSGVQWTLMVTASTDVFNHHFPNLRFELTVKDLNDLVEQLAVELPKALVGKALESGIDEATRFLKDLGLPPEETSKLLTNVFGKARDEVVRAAAQIYALAKGDVEKILRDFGAAADEIAGVLKRLGLNFEDLIPKLPKDFDKRMKEIARDMDKALERIINHIGGITPRQMKALDDLNKAEQVIRRYLEQVDIRNREIKQIIQDIEDNMGSLQKRQQSILDLTNEAKKVASDAAFKEQLDKDKIKLLTQEREEIEKARDMWKAECEDVEKR